MITQSAIESQGKTDTVNTSHSDLEAPCLAHMAGNGFHNAPPLPLDLSGNRVDFDGRGEDGREIEWYIASLKDDGALIVTYNSHHDSIKKINAHYVFSSGANEPLSETQHEALKQRVAESKKKRDQETAVAVAEEEKKRQKKATRARERFNKASPTGDSEYLKRKKVGAHGARFEKRGSETVLLLPMLDERGEIQALQEIFDDGEKKFTNTAGGLFLPLGTIVNGKLIRVSEGYSTSASCFESTGCIIPHVVAFSASAYSKDDPDREGVVQILRRLYPDSPIQICADGNKDPSKEECGITEAKKAVSAVANCSFVYPTFLKGRDKDVNGKPYKDFNDLMIAEGKEAVKEQIEKIQSIISAVQIELKNLNLLQKEEPCANFSIKDLPKPLSQYIESICETTDAHPIMITTSVISSISGIIKKKLFIPKGEYFQILYTNVWMLNLYKSGGFKTTALENGANIAREISKKVRGEIKEIEKLLGGDKSKKEEFKQRKLEASLKDVILPNKITAEALLEHLSEGHSGIILTGEFGAWLQNMEKGHNADLKALFTELYDVPPCFRYKTRTQGDHILEKPFFSICGVSTLTWLKENLKPNDVSSGFFARFLLFTPPQQDCIPPALPRFAKPSNPQAEWMVKQTLENMDNEYEYKLAPSAKLVFESAHSSLYSMTKAYTEKCQEILDPYLKRWSPYILKIAMIMRLFEDPTSKEISDTAIHSAMVILLPAIRSTAQLFQGELGESDQQRKKRLIFEWICNRIKKGKPPTWAALITSDTLDGGAAMYEYPMKTLVEGGLVNEIQKPLKRDWLYVPVDKSVG